jgi:two-component system response regulator PilR (NtrC family)
MAGERLLVVDDEESIRDIFADYFGSIGYEVETATSGKDGLEKFVPDRFDCVICDLVMPEMDGLEFLRRLWERDSKTPFFMMTGYPSVETAVEAINQGAYDYITKPLNFEDVRIKLERALRSRDVERSLKKVTGVLWGLIVSIPIWLILGIVLGIVWKKL